MTRSQVLEGRVTKTCISSEEKPANPALDCRLIGNRRPVGRPNVSQKSEMGATVQSEKTLGDASQCPGRRRSGEIEESELTARGRNEAGGSSHRGESRGPTARRACDFFANALNDHNEGQTLKSLGGDSSARPHPCRPSDQPILLTPTEEVAHPLLTLTKAPKSMRIQSDYDQRMTQNNLTVFHQQICMVKSHSDTLMAISRADADTKHRGKEQDLALLSDFVIQCAEQCGQLQSYVQTAHNSILRVPIRHETEKRHATSEYSARRISDLERFQRIHSGELQRWQHKHVADTSETKQVYAHVLNGVRAVRIFS